MLSDSNRIVHVVLDLHALYGDSPLNFWGSHSILYCNSMPTTDFYKMKVSRVSRLGIGNYLTAFRL